MSRTPDSKSEATRQRILNAASARLRTHGIEQTGLRELMEQAGLTRGGFYFHFPNKDALVTEAITQAAGETADAYVSLADEAPAGRQLQALIEYYLSPAHRDHPATGCLVASLASETGRAGKKQRTAFSSAIGVTLQRIAPLLPGESPGQRTLNAGLLLSSMSGVLNVARALPDARQSEALLAAAREFYIRSFCGE
ncbi:TetR family transcriptional regulator [Pseudoduganella eburnea]|uniref:TetR family transcriptional regulator n=1 Tax=Massilia eburnea TaxID=1776165 RepID=A0A6L6QAA7_9BURK|nr:TetR/AcrR family transcriptional regulator [Massilia eburnea]MTW09145.1 TetR family transcriptional regulator [Massilia eburnea]